MDLAALEHAVVVLSAFVGVGVALVGLVVSLVRTDIKAGTALKEAAEAKIERQRLETKIDDRFDKRDYRIGELEKEFALVLGKLGDKFDVAVGEMRGDVKELSKAVHTLMGSVGAKKE